MTMWSPEKVMRFREKLVGELTGHQLWYHPSKEKNRDIIVNHPECPYAQKNGNVAEHRYIWWLHHPDQPIKYNEMIHHINGDHKDNRIENLEKLKDKQHGQRHKELKKLNGIG
jgi:hypothetical protein